MAGEIEAYLEAQWAVKQHSVYVQQVLRPIHAFSGSAAHGGWQRIRIPNEMMPSELIVPGTTAFEPMSWPTGEQIKNMILEWHRLQSLQRKAWEPVPKELRGGLTPPPI